MIPRLLVLGMAFLALTSRACYAQGKAKLAREAAEYVVRKFDSKAAHEGVETLARKIEVLALKYGDEAILAVRKVGPGTFRLVDQAGKGGIPSIKLMAKYGDNAIWVVAKPKRMAIFVKLGDEAAEAMLKHGEIAEPLLESVGTAAAEAFKAVNSQNGRRVAMLAKEGYLTKVGRTLELLDVVAQHGDRAMEFIWTNKDSLLASGTLAAFLSSPDLYLDDKKTLPGAPTRPWLAIAVIAAISGTIAVAATFFWFRSRFKAPHAGDPVKPQDVDSVFHKTDVVSRL